MPAKYPKDFLRFVESITAKRPRTVIQHILKKGHVTTEELHLYRDATSALRRLSRELCRLIIEFRTK
jgi:hypothetical protein